MKSSLVTATGFVLVCALSLTACGGGGAKNTIQTSNSTIGQELMDLEASYQQGLITEKQYNKTKEQILKRYN